MIILAVQRNGTTLVWQNQAYIHMYLYIHTRPGVPAQVLLERFHCRFFSTELLFRMEPASSHCTSLRSSRTLTDFYANFGYTQLSSHHQDRNLKTFPYCQGSSLSQKGPWNSKWYRLGRESRLYCITNCAIGPQKPTQDSSQELPLCKHEDLGRLQDLPLGFSWEHTAEHSASWTWVAWALWKWCVAARTELFGSVLRDSPGKKRRLVPHLLKHTGTAIENIIHSVAMGAKSHPLVKTKKSLNPQDYQNKPHRPELH